MNCTACGSASPPDAKFCGSCGSPMSSVVSVDPETTQRSTEAITTFWSKVVGGFKFVLSITVLLVVVSIASVFAKEYARHVYEVRKAHSWINQVVSEMNKGLPALVDDQTRLDKVEAGDGLLIIFRYTFVNASGGEVNIDRLRNNHFPVLLARGCQDLRVGIGLGIAHRFTFSGNDGAHVDSLTVDGRSCGRRRSP